MTSLAEQECASPGEWLLVAELLSGACDNRTCYQLTNLILIHSEKLPQNLPGVLAELRHLRAGHDSTICELERRVRDEKWSCRVLGACHRSAKNRLRIGDRVGDR
jgi:hypothetical protein